MAKGMGCPALKQLGKAREELRNDPQGKELPAPVPVGEVIKAW